VNSAPDNQPGAAMTTAHRPIIAISMGDPLGIGPEIIAKAMGDRRVRSRAKFRIYGSASALDSAARQVGVESAWARVPADADLATLRASEDHDVLVLDDPAFDFAALRQSVPSPQATATGGEQSFRWVEQCIAAVRSPHDDPRRADAMVTAPISKSSWHLAGHTQYPGHTELLAERCHAKRHGMLFVGPSLRVMLVTIHIPLASVSEQLTLTRVYDAIDLAAQACREMGITSPRIGVCGVNPHAGEGGLMGEEDDRVIRPAVELAVSHGVDASGPWPGDTVFLKAAAPPRGEGRYDCVVAMYHDQGLIPMKLLDRERTVNMTVGLGVVRTSPAHGTAFDIAGRGIADPGSMEAAIDLACRMAAGHRAGAAVG
jgi:4-hydroxythreonine-4-phosphate dehydrogenase